LSFFFKNKLIVCRVIHYLKLNLDYLEIEGISMTTVKYHDETKKNVCQSDLIRETAINLAISQVTAEKVIKEYIKVLKNHILVDDRTTIIGLGVFYQAFDRRKANLKSAAKTLPYKSMRFKPSRMLNKQIMFLANNMNK